MSVRKGTLAAGLGIGLISACAVLAILNRRHYSARPEIPMAVGNLAEPSTRPPLLIAAKNPPPGTARATNELQSPRLLDSAATNKSASVAGEDRIVALVNEGNKLLGQKKYAEAADQFAQALAIEPGDEDLHYNLAIALAKLGRTEEAKKEYTAALEIFPEYAEAHNNLGNQLMNENKLDEAIEHFREAIKVRPDDASFHNNLGTAFGRRRKLPEALAEFREAVRLKPDYVEARVNLGNACLTAGQVDEAIVQLNEALRLQPDFRPALQGMQRARQSQGAGSPGK